MFVLAKIHPSKADLPRRSRRSAKADRHQQLATRYHFIFQHSIFTFSHSLSHFSSQFAKHACDETEIRKTRLARLISKS